MPWRLPRICMVWAWISVLNFSTPLWSGHLRVRTLPSRYTCEPLRRYWLAVAQSGLGLLLGAFGQVLAGDFRQTIAKDHAVPLGGFLHFTGLLVFPLVGGGDGDIGDLAAT